MIKVGLMIGGQYGEGALRVGGKTVGYYNTVAASYGLQAGAQSFGYVLFFMTESALEYLTKSEGWEVGVGPSLVVVDEGVAKTLTTSTAKDDIYAFIFGQEGLMAGLVSRVRRYPGSRLNSRRSLYLSGSKKYNVTNNTLNPAFGENQMTITFKKKCTRE